MRRNVILDFLRGYREFDDASHIRCIRLYRNIPYLSQTFDERIDVVEIRIFLLFLFAQIEIIIIEDTSRSLASLASLASLPDIINLDIDAQVVVRVIAGIIQSDNTKNVCLLRGINRLKEVLAKCHHYRFYGNKLYINFSVFLLHCFASFASGLLVRLLLRFASGLLWFRVGFVFGSNLYI